MFKELVWKMKHKMKAHKDHPNLERLSFPDSLSSFSFVEYKLHFFLHTFIILILYWKNTGTRNPNIPTKLTVL